MLEMSFLLEIYPMMVLYLRSAILVKLAVDDQKFVVAYMNKIFSQFVTITVACASEIDGELRS